MRTLLRTQHEGLSGGKGTIQDVCQILFLPPFGYFTMLVSQFSVGHLHICMRGSRKVTRGALYMWLFAWLRGLNNTL